jgi:heme A synthase
MLAYAALIAAVGQVTLGGVVRVTGSGLGCPDWPLCHGRIVPPFEVATLIEYSHRLSASLLGILVLGVALLAWRSQKRGTLVTVSSYLALVLVIAAAVLGGVTVRTELAWWVVLIHLGIAELMIACLVVAIAAARTPAGDSVLARDRRGPGGFHLIVIGTVLAGFALILSGSYMVGLGYGSSCGTWPLCNGSLLPSGEPYTVHMAHRFLAGLVAVSVGWLAFVAWTRPSLRRDLNVPARFLVGLMSAQVLLGAATVWAGFSAPLKTAHLTTATLLWVALVFFAASNFASRRPVLRSPSSGASLAPARESVTP